MPVTATTHLNFRGNAREALEFYHSVFGGQVMVATYGQVGVPQDAPDGGATSFAPISPDSPDAGHVAFGVVIGANGVRVAGYDVYGATGGGVAGTSTASGRRADGLTHTESVFMLLNGDTIDELTPLWKALIEGGTVIAALTPATSNAPSYGMITDRFGITWIFGVTPG